MNNSSPVRSNRRAIDQQQRLRPRPRTSTAIGTRRWPRGVPRTCGYNANFCMAVNYKQAEILRFFYDLGRPERSVSDARGDVHVLSAGRNGAVFAIKHVSTTNSAGNVNHRLITALKCALPSSSSAAAAGDESPLPPGAKRVRRSDNLLYEAFVGLRDVNALADRFPLFVRTYGVYQLLDPKLQARIQELLHRYQRGTDSSPSPSPRPSPPPPPPSDDDDDDDEFALPKNDLVRILRGRVMALRSPEDVRASARISCRHNRSVMIHMEFVNAAVTLHDHMQELVAQSPSAARTQTMETFWAYGCASILYQLYAPLAAVRDSFTHYDLHARNVLISEVPMNKYIRLVYHLRGGREVVVATRHFVRLIDYGRCYSRSSSTLRSALCQVCGRTCTAASRDHVMLDDMGDSPPTRKFLIPTAPNRSQDLRAARIVRFLLEDGREPEAERRRFDASDFLGRGLRAILRAVRFDGKTETPERLGGPSGFDTRAFLGSGGPAPPPAILNVKQLFDALHAYCSQRAFEKHVEMFAATASCIGEQHVYLDPGSARATLFRPES